MGYPRMRVFVPWWLAIGLRVAWLLGLVMYLILVLTVLGLARMAYGAFWLGRGLWMAAQAHHRNAHGR